MRGLTDTRVYFIIIIRIYEAQQMIISPNIKEKKVVYCNLRIVYLLILSHWFYSYYTKRKGIFCSRKHHLYTKCSAICYKAAYIKILEQDANNTFFLNVNT